MEMGMTLTLTKVNRKSVNRKQICNILFDGNSNIVMFSLSVTVYEIITFNLPR